MKRNSEGYLVTEFDNCCRYITEFHKIDDTPPKNIHLNSFDLEEIKENLKMKITPEDTYLYLCYPITNENKDYFEKIANVKFDLKAYQYYLEAHRNE